MTGSQFYLPTLLPQWGIFTGVVLITVGYIDKRNLLTRVGWLLLIATSLTALYFNFFSGLNTFSDINEPESTASLLISAGWQTVAGGIPAIVSLLMFQFKRKRYPLIAVLTIIYFVLTFFLYLQLSGSSEEKVKNELKTEHKQKY